MKKQLKAVRLFHETYNLTVRNQPTINIPKEQPILRFNLMTEENEEYLEAALNNNIVEVADALGDMLYILCGTILDHGLQHKIEEIFDEIHKSNMSKLGTDGKPLYREDGKVMKGPNFLKPNLKRVLDSNNDK
jgi:predicted HAD superfamily Cof-like phosphohydrolase